MELRDYQIEAIEKIEANIAFGSKEMCLYAVTSFGKSLVAAELVNRALEKGKSIAITVAISELIWQLQNTIREHCNTNPLIIKADYEDTKLVNNRVAIIMEQTAYAREIATHYDILVKDEYHNSRQKRWEKVVKNINPNVIVGMSATPWDEKGYYIPNRENVIETVTTTELVKKGYLSPIKFYKTSATNDIATSSNETIAKKRYISDDDAYRIVSKYDEKIIREVLNKGYDGYKDVKDCKTIWFCSNIEHCEEVTKLINEIVPKEEIIVNYEHDLLTNKPVTELQEQAVAVHSKNSDDYNRNMIQMFRDGKIKHLVSVSKLAIGFDVPDVLVGVDLRPTTSDRTFYQRIGRLRRKMELKEFGMWIDAVGNLERHGTDEFEHLEPIPENRKKLLEQKKQKQLIGVTKGVDTDVISEIKILIKEYKKLKKKSYEDMELEELMLIFNNEDILENLFIIAMYIANELGIEFSTNKKKITLGGVHWIYEPYKEYLEKYEELAVQNDKQLVYEELYDTWVYIMKRLIKGSIKRSNKFVSLRFTFDWIKEESFWKNKITMLENLIEYGNEDGYEIKYEFDIDEEEIPF
jgi:superfamily II DNA or RNA helicase